MLNSLPDWIAEKIMPEPMSGCWLWTHTHNYQGYGVIKINSKRRTAHQLVYENKFGEVPKGLILDHLCRVRSCCNPDHLEQVTHGQNVLRGNAASALNKVKTHCHRGHKFTKKNTYIYNGKYGKQRVCRKCNVINQRNSKANKLPTYEQDTPF